MGSESRVVGLVGMTATTSNWASLDPSANGFHKFTPTISQLNRPGRLPPVEGQQVKFGVQIENHLGIGYDDVLKIALEAERLRYDGLFICDHLMGRNEETARQPCLDPWVTLGALASATTNLQLGTLVSAVGFRYPSVLAKMSATLDSISGGRLQLSLGAGWFEPEYVAYGIPFPPIRERIRQLREAIRIIRMMWTEDKPSFKGTSFNVKDAWSFPKPSKPRIWVGGTGEEKILKLIADLADGWNATGTAVEEYEHKLRVLESYCSKNFRSIKDVERSYYAPGLTARNEEEFLSIFKQYYGQFKRQDEAVEDFVKRVREGGRSFIGTVEEVIDKISKFQKLGVSYVIFYFPDKARLGLMREFANVVLPAFK